jgi:hypothetical protein
LATGVPIFIIPAYWIYFQETPMMSDFMGLDINFQILIFVITALILSGLGLITYKLSTHFLYSKLITRIEEIINDMEELMKI